MKKTIPELLEEGKSLGLELSGSKTRRELVALIRAARKLQSKKPAPAVVGDKAKAEPKAKKDRR